VKDSGRSPDLWFTLLPGLPKKILVADLGFVPTHSDAIVTDLHRIPFSSRCARHLNLNTSQRSFRNILREGMFVNNFSNWLIAATFVAEDGDL